MNPARLFLCLAALSSALAAEPIASLREMRTAADAFLQALDNGQRQKAAFPFTSDQRENFRFTPQTRTGLPLKEMTEPQRQAAMKLLDSALSEKGKLKATQILTLESILRDLEKRPDYRDPEKYYVSIFGTPGDAKGWGWKFEGHHLALNYTVVGDSAFSVTPSFFGTNPAEVREGPHKGLRVLAEEEDLARALTLILLEGGKSGVIFSEKPPEEILTAENRKATALEPVGILAADMNEPQKKALRQLIEAYTGRHRADLSKADLAKIEKAGFDKIRFGWSGSTAPGKAWYYRVQGPTFLMEAANSQNNANHIHATWRAFDGDFGRDLLHEHYEDHGHKHDH